MAENKNETVGFAFQAIPIEDAHSMALSGSGAYADLKEYLLKRIPTLNATESFVFGLPKN